jgi:peptidoglycan biosynthesis protein MviN/MurJ (putative lipid II flippase)
VKNSVLIALIAGANLSALVLFQWSVIASLGVGIETDAYYASTVVTQFVLAVTSGVVVQTLVPILAGESPENERDIAWSALWLAVLLFGLLALIIVSSASFWVDVIFSGFSAAAKQLTVNLARIQVVTMFFLGLQSVLMAGQYGKGHFILPEIKALAANMVAIGILLVTLPRFGIYSAAYAYAIRAFILSALLCEGLGRPIVSVPSSKILGETLRRMKPMLAGSLYFRTEDIVDRYLLSNALPGILTLYNLAQQLLQSANTIFSKMMCAPLTTLLSIDYKSGDLTQFVARYRNRLALALLLTVCVLLLSLGALYAAERLGVSIGRFGASDLAALAEIMTCLGGLLIFGVLGQISAIAYYAKGDTLRPTIIGIVCYTLYLPAKIYVFFEHGVLGLATATSVYYGVGLLVKMVVFDVNAPLFSARSAIPGAIKRNGSSG